MAQLTLHDIDAELVKRLERRAASHGLTVEEEHRRILGKALGPESLNTSLDGAKTQRLKDVLLCGPVIPDQYASIFDRDVDYGRDINFE